VKSSDREKRGRDAAREGRRIPSTSAPAEAPAPTSTDKARPLRRQRRAGHGRRCHGERDRDTFATKFAIFNLVDSGAKPPDSILSTKPSHDQGAGDEPLTSAQLRQHADCMRAHGVNVPDPIATANGWTIPVKDPPFQQDQKAWRNAFFVSCRLLNVSEKLVLGAALLPRSRR